MTCKFVNHKSVSFIKFLCFSSQVKFAKKTSVIKPNQEVSLLVFNDKTLTFYCQQLGKTVLSCTNPVIQSAVFTQSTLMVQVPFMCSVTKQQPVEGGQCSRRDWLAPLISTAAGPTTRMALAT